MINFEELGGTIRERENRIRILQAETPRLLEPDEKGKPIIALEHKPRALEIAKELKSLREKNKLDSNLLEKAQQISERYNIPLDELHQLSMSIPYLEKRIAELELQVEKHKKSDAKQFEREKDSQFSCIGQDIKALEQARIKLANHKIAAVTVDDILREREFEKQGAE
jgi:hypothetical protein